MEESNLSIPQVGVSSKQNGDIIRRLCHHLHHQSQLSHPLSCIGLTALKVGRHETKLVAFEQHLILKERHFEVDAPGKDVMNCF